MSACTSCGSKPRRKRKRREREIPEVAAGVRRQVESLGRRVAKGDPYDLPELVAIRDAVEAAVVEAVRHQHEGTYTPERTRQSRIRHGEPPGFSWAEIAAGLGATRQGVAQWYQRAVRRLDVTAAAS